MQVFFDSIIHWTVATQTLRVLNELLIVLMLAEILRIRFAAPFARTFSSPSRSSSSV